MHNSNSSNAKVYWGTVGLNCSVDFFPGAKYLSAVEKSAFTDILSEAACSHSCLVQASSGV